MNKLKGKWLLQCCTLCLRNRLNMSSSSSGGLDLAFYSYEKLAEGKPAAQPMIMLHGLMGSRQNFQSLAKVFGKTGRKIVTVDARNHGESAHVEDMDYFLFRDDLLRLMDSQNIEQAVILGHSMGGKTAMVTALTYPERVGSLIVVDVSPAVSPSINRHPLYLEAMLRLPLMTIYDDPSTPLSKIRRHVVQELEEIIKDENMRHFLASNLMIKDERLRWKCNLDSIINNFPTVASFPEFKTEEYLGSTLFLGGSNSDYITEANHDDIYRLFPMAKIQHIEGAGHWVHADKPQLFIQAVNNFLLESGL